MEIRSQTSAWTHTAANNNISRGAVQFYVSLEAQQRTSTAVERSLGSHPKDEAIRQNCRWRFDHGDGVSPNTVTIRRMS